MEAPKDGCASGARLLVATSHGLSRQHFYALLPANKNEKVGRLIGFAMKRHDAQLPCHCPRQGPNEQPASDSWLVV
jgi:hypothetical protein